jgi:hypothetical protein
VRGKDYEYEGEVGETLHAGGGRDAYLLVPIVPPGPRP